MDSWRVQEAAKQVRSRELNEIVGARARRTSGAENVIREFSCECGDPGCSGNVSLTVAEYEFVRERPDRFVVVVNHENPEVESVVTEDCRFAVVETLVGEASKIALRSNPRRLI